MSKRSEEGHLILYKKHGCYDCVVVGTSTPVKMWRYVLGIIKNGASSLNSDFCLNILGKIYYYYLVCFDEQRI